MDSWFSFHSTFLVLVFIIFLVPVSLSSYDWYSSCSNLFDCGNITDVGYPFWGDGRPDACGNPDLKLNCEGTVTTIEIMDVTYRVLDVDHSKKILKIAREDYLMGGICSPHWVSTTLNSELFYFGPGYRNITLFYGCPPTNYYMPPLFSCTIDGIANQVGYIEDGAHGPGSCAKSVVVPVRVTDQYPDIGNWTKSIIEDAIKGGFDLKWKEDTAACNACIRSKGVCGYDLSKNQTTCYCPNPSNGLPCAAGAPQTPMSNSELSGCRSGDRLSYI